MARPKSEDKKQALLEAATAAFAQSGIAASTSAIARSAGVAEGTLFRYFATKDERISTGIFCHSAWFFGGKLVPGGHSAGDNQWIDRRQ